MIFSASLLLPAPQSTSSGSCHLFLFPYSFPRGVFSAAFCSQTLFTCFLCSGAKNPKETFFKVFFIRTLLSVPYYSEQSQKPGPLTVTQSGAPLLLQPLLQQASHEILATGTSQAAVDELSKCPLGCLKHNWIRGQM